MTEVFIEYYAKCWCPSCQTPNWLYSHRNDGDDTSYSDFFALKCWKCGAANWLHCEAQSECQQMYGEYENEDTDDERQIPVKPEDHAELGREHP